MSRGGGGFYRVDCSTHSGSRTGNEYITGDLMCTLPSALLKFLQLSACTAVQRQIASCRQISASSRLTSEVTLIRGGFAVSRPSETQLCYATVTTTIDSTSIRVRRDFQPARRHDVC